MTPWVPLRNQNQNQIQIQIQAQIQIQRSLIELLGCFAGIIFVWLFGFRIGQSEVYLLLLGFWCVLLGSWPQAGGRSGPGLLF